MTENGSSFHTGKLPMDFLQRILQAYTRTDPRVVTGPAVGEDVAVIDIGDRYIVLKTDPITFATDQIGWYVVNVNANDIATSGARPLWMLNTILLPERQATPELVESIFAQLHQACEQLDIALVGGHTEVTWGLDRPIVVGVMLGEVAKGDLLTTSGAQVGDAVLLVKGIAIEATALIAREKADDLLRRGYAPAFIERAQHYLYDPGISVLDVARVASRHPGVHAMHDPTEGGLATGLHELAAASETGIRVDGDQVHIYDDTVPLCAEYGLDPLGAIASGALIVAVDSAHADALLRTYAEAGIMCARIGQLLRPEEGLWLNHDGRCEPLPRYDVDEITRVF